MDSASLTMLKKAGAQAAAVAKELEPEPKEPGPDAAATADAEASDQSPVAVTVHVPEGVNVEAAHAVADSATPGPLSDPKAPKAKSKKKGSLSTDVAKQGEVMPPDIIADIVHEIENLKEPQAHATLAAQLEIGPMADFKIGGLLALIKDNAWYQGYHKMEDYVANKVEPTTGIGYRKAMYLIEVYNAIVESGIAWAKLAGLGWTKMQIIARVLTKENADQWLQIAKEQNAVTLVNTVKEAVKKGNAPAQLEDQTTSVVTTMTFKVHTDQKATIEAAIDKAKGIAQTDVSTVALEYICLDYMGGQTMAQRLQAVGPAQSGKAVKKAFADEATLAVLMKELGLEEGLNAIAAAFPGINIDVSVPDAPTTEVPSNTGEEGSEAA
jgi:hypothetical protein